MSVALSTGKALRISRLSGPGDGRFLFVPLDHSVSDGPIRGGEQFTKLVGDISESGADAIIVHKGRARCISPDVLGRTALIVHLSASTRHAPDSTRKVLVAEVEDAVRAGADGVSVHVNIGSSTEASQLADLGATASACERFGLPLLAMVYLRGPRITRPDDPVELSHAANIAADLGADIVKTVLASPPTGMAEVVWNSPIPVVVAGGADGASILEVARNALAAGCDGVAIGRGVFTHPEPRKIVHELRAVVHDRENFTDKIQRTQIVGAQ